MTKFEVTDAMLDAAEQAYDTIAAIEHDAWCYTAPTRAAITAAIEASGLVEENARLREAIFDIKQNWDWWDEDRYDRCSSVVGDAIADALKGGEG
jgi:hypothetical protein